MIIMDLVCYQCNGCGRVVPGSDLMTHACPQPTLWGYHRLTPQVADDLLRRRLETPTTYRRR